MDIKEGTWVTINTGSLKDAQGKIKRVDQKRAQVLVEIDRGFVLNTYETHRMNWNNINIDSPIVFRNINDTDKRMYHSLSWIDHDHKEYSGPVNLAGTLLEAGENQIFTRTFDNSRRDRSFIVIWKPLRAARGPETAEQCSSEMRIFAPAGTIRVTIYHKRYITDLSARIPQEAN